MQTAAWCLLDMCDVQLGTVLLSVHMVGNGLSLFSCGPGTFWYKNGDNSYLFVNK